MGHSSIVCMSIHTIYWHTKKISKKLILGNLYMQIELHLSIHMLLMVSKKSLHSLLLRMIRRVGNQLKTQMKNIIEGLNSYEYFIL